MLISIASTIGLFLYGEDLVDIENTFIRRVLVIACGALAREINALISSSSVHVSRGVSFVGRAGDALGDIDEE